MAFAQESPVLPRNDTSESTKLNDLSVELMKAIERKDQSAIERLVAEDFFVTSPGDSGELKRSEWIANGISMNWTAPEFRNLRVDIYDDTAVVTSSLHFSVSGGKLLFPISTDAQIVDVWKQEHGQWRITARHLGAYSIGEYLRIIGGFVGGLIFSLLLWGLLRVKRRLAARKKLAAAI